MGFGEGGGLGDGDTFFWVALAATSFIYGCYCC